MKEFKTYPKMKELFDQETGYVFFTENIKSYLISRESLFFSDAWEFPANPKLKSLIELIESLKLITWVDIGCAGEIVASPGKGDLINRFNILNKQLSFYN